MELSELDVDAITRAISEHARMSVKQVTGSEHRGGHNHDVTVEFWGQRGQRAYHVEKMPGLGWQVIGLA